MNNQAILSFSKKCTSLALKRKPEILTALGIAGFFSAIYMAAKAAPKAVMLIEEKKKEKEVEKLGPIDTIKTVWICFLPTALTSIISAGCLVGASSENLRRNAALATAYTLSESAAKDYQEKVIESIGEKKEQGIRDSIAKEKLEKNPVIDREVIITEKGNTLCFDVTSGRYFKSDIENLRKIVNELNRRMMSEMYVSLNDFYYEVGLKSTDVGDDLGWNISDGFIELRFSSQISTDGSPCLVVEYRIAPKYEYRNR